MSRAAVFLDRDGTLIRDYHFIGNPEAVELLPGVGEAVHRLNALDWLVVVVTNQSGIARGYFTTADYERVRQRTQELLAAHGGTVNGTYMCPHHPDFTGPCECRKPGTLLFRQAARDLDIALDRSWLVGDKLRDVSPATELGARGILIPNEETPEPEVAVARGEHRVSQSLDDAVGIIAQSTG